MDKHKISILILSLFVSISFSCKRESNNETTENQSVQENSELLSKSDIAKLQAKKYKFKKEQLSDGYTLNIPYDYEFEATEFSEDEFEEYFSETTIESIIQLNKAKKINKIDLNSKLNNYYEEVAEQSVYIFSGINDYVLKISDVKKIYSEEIANIYLEDDSSFIFEDKFESLFLFTINYDAKNKKQLFYSAEISWSKHNLKKDKLAYFYFLIKMSKNFLNPNLQNYDYKNWEDYLANNPAIETSIYTDAFKNIEKEYIFMEANETTSFRVGTNYPLLDLFYATNSDEIIFNDFLYNSYEIDTDAEFSNFLKVDKYSDEIIKFTLENNYYLIERIDKNYDDEIIKKYDIIAEIEKGGKKYFLKNSKSLMANELDFYKKIIAYYSKK